MTHDIAEHLRRLSSRNGRYWLRESRPDELEDANAAASEELPFKSTATKFDASGKFHESVVVAIPDVAQQNKVAIRKSAVPSRSVTAKDIIARPNASVAAISASAAPLTRATINAPPLQSPTESVTTRVDQAESVVEPVARQIATPQPATVGAFPQPAEPPVTPLPLDDAVAAARSTQSTETESAIIKIADSILSTFPVSAPSAVMIAGSGAALSVDETAARVAAELASRELGRVLLIDSDFADRRLTSASGMVQHAGLSEVMNIALPWEDAILKSGSSKLDFMPVGSCPHKRWTPKRLLREALAEIRQQYQFICITVGDAHSVAASTWAGISDGAMLVVSAASTSDAMAESAVQELRKDGARMLGCIVADATE